jgi:hypothetical protein
VNKRPTRERSGRSENTLALLPAQLQPITADQRADAVALLADLLLAAARRADGDGDLLAADGGRLEEGLAA